MLLAKKPSPYKQEPIVGVKQSRTGMFPSLFFPFSLFSFFPFLPSTSPVHDVLLALSVQVDEVVFLSDRAATELTLYLRLLAAQQVGLNPRSLYRFFAESALNRQ